MRETEPAAVPETAGGLVFRIDEVSVHAVSSLKRWRDGRPAAERELVVKGALTGEGVPRMFRMNNMMLDEVLDERGRDLLERGQMTSEPPPRVMRGGWMRSPVGEQAFQSIQVKLQLLDELPRSLSRLSGHVDAKVVDEIQQIEFDLKAGDEFIEVSPEFSYRIAKCTVEKNSVSVKVEYRVRLSSSTSNRPDSPALMEVVFVDGDPSANMASGYSWPSETRIGDVVSGEYVRSSRGFSGEAPTKGRLEVVMRVRPVRYDFELRDIPLSGPDR